MKFDIRLDRLKLKLLIWSNTWTCCDWWNNTMYTSTQHLKLPDEFLTDESKLTLLNLSKAIQLRNVYSLYWSCCNNFVIMDAPNPT